MSRIKSPKSILVIWGKLVKIYSEKNRKKLVNLLEK